MAHTDLSQNATCVFSSVNAIGITKAYVNRAELEACPPGLADMHDLLAFVANDRIHGNSGTQNIIRSNNVQSSSTKHLGERRAFRCCVSRGERKENPSKEN